MAEQKTIKAHCNSCGQQTRHAIRCSHTATLEGFVKEIDSSVEEKQTFDILQCLGCDQMAVRSTGEHEIYGEAIPQFYPPRISRRIPPWSDKLPNSIGAMVREVYRALQAGSSRLATIGARTIVDLVILDKVGDIGTFHEKLVKLEEIGYVGRKNGEFVAAALDAGSAAAHRGVKPDSTNLNRVMDIVESLLESVYILDEAAAELRKATPPRQRLQKKAGEV